MIAPTEDLMLEIESSKTRHYWDILQTAPAGFDNSMARIYAHVAGNSTPKKLDFPKSMVDRYGFLMPTVTQSPKNTGQNSMKVLFSAKVFS